MEGLPKSRAEAKACGATHYFTWVPCINGHTDKRWTSCARCVSCAREYQRDTENRKKKNASRQRWRLANVEVLSQRRRDHYQQNAERLRAVHNENKRQMYKENPERFLAAAKVWRQSDPDRTREVNSRARRKYVEKHPEMYLRKIALNSLLKGTPLAATDIPDELIKLKVKHLRATRELRKVVK